MSDLARLAKPFPQEMIHANPSGGGSYVGHPQVRQKLLLVCGPYKWEVKELIRGYVPAIAPNPDGRSQRAKDGRPALENAVVGVVGTLTVKVDGEWVTDDGIGDCEDPHNWTHDGQRAKDAESDAIKRAAMNCGVALHLWAQDHFFLYEQLQRQEAKVAEAGPGVGEAPRPAEAIENTTANPGGANAVQAVEVATFAGEGASTLGEDPPSANRIAHLKARNVALLGAGVSIDTERKARGIPSLSKCLAKDLDEFETMLDELEAREAERAAQLREQDERRVG